MAEGGREKGREGKGRKEGREGREGEGDLFGSEEVDGDELPLASVLFVLLAKQMDLQPFQLAKPKQNSNSSNIFSNIIKGGHVAGVGVGADDAFEREGGLGARRVHSKTLGQKITKGLS